MSTEFSHIGWRSKGILMYLDELIPSSIDNQNIVSHQIPIANPKLFKSSEEIIEEKTEAVHRSQEHNLRVDLRRVRVIS